MKRRIMMLEEQLDTGSLLSLTAPAFAGGMSKEEIHLVSKSFCL
jgi:hypothetical protein